MKKLKLVLIILFVVIICGCTDTSPKDELTPEEFVNKMSSLNLEYTDLTKNFGYAKAVYVVNTKKYVITYVSGNKQYDMEGLFIDECANAMADAGDDYDKEVKAGEGWENLSIDGKKKYYYVSWIGSSYINVEASLSAKEDVMEIVNELGY